MKLLEDKFLAGFDLFFASYVTIDFLIDDWAGDQPYILAPIIAATSGVYKALSHFNKSPRALSDICLFATAGYMTAGVDAIARAPSMLHTAQGASYIVIAGMYLWQQYLLGQNEVKN